MSRACITAHKTAVEANNGFLCTICYDRLSQALQKAPSVLQHLRQVYVLRPQMNLDAPKPLKKEPPAPFNLDAWQLAEDMWQAIQDKYIPIAWTHQEVYSNAYTACNELQAKLDEVVNSKEVIYLLPLIQSLNQAIHRYPMQEKSRATLLPCPSCNLKTIYSPPQEFGDELEVKCHNCSFVIPPEKMEFYANLAERERA